MTLLTEAQKVTIKRLAEAMLAGAKKRPQTVEVLFQRADGLNGNPNGEICSCALGAAWEGSHPDFDAENWWATRLSKPYDAVIGMSHVLDFFDHFEQINVLNPMGTGGDALDDVIIELNDQHGWTREKIANWLLDMVEDARAQLDRYFGMPIKDWPDSLRASMNNVKPGSGDGIAETIAAWIAAGKVELNAKLQPK